MDMIAVQAVQDMTGKSVHEVAQDCYGLRNLQAHRQEDRNRTKEIMDGGAQGLARALGFKVNHGEQAPPVANLIYSGATRLAQKIGNAPEVRIAPYSDSDAARRQAEKSERILRGIDEFSDWELAHPQLARWVPGYGYGVTVIRDGRDNYGNPYAFQELRDPFEIYPARWGVQQQPDRMCSIYAVDVKQLAVMYPANAKEILAGNHGGGGYSGSQEGWAGPTHTGTKEVAEYWDVNGTWTLLLDNNVLLDFAPNPIFPLVPFDIAKRFSFNRLSGHFDQAIGLMTAQARINAMTVVAMEEQINAPVIVNGKLVDNVFRFGRHSYNEIEGGGAQRLDSPVDARVFQQARSLEEQLRTTVGYSQIDDSKSPNSFVTGTGLSKLQAGVDNEVKEYQLILRKHKERLDEKVLCWEEKAYGSRKKPIYGYNSDAKGVEFYQPSKDIAGRYRTHRIASFMEGWDDQGKIVTGLQLVQAGAISLREFRDNLKGIKDSHAMEKEINGERAGQLADSTLEAMAQQGDPRAILAMIERMPEGPQKQSLKKFFTPEQPEVSPEEQAMMDEGAGVGAEDNSATIMSRMFADGGAQLGTQVVGSF